MKKYLKLGWAACAAIIALQSEATSVNLYPFVLNVAPQRFDYPRDHFQPVTLATTQHTMPELSSPHDIAIKPQREAITLSGEKIYRTNVDGIGVKLSVNDRPVSAMNGETQPLGTFSQVTVSAELVVYEKLAAGDYPISQLQLGGIQIAQDSYLMPIWFEPTTVSVKQRTCELIQKNQTVKLQTVMQTELAHRGSEAFGGTFQLGLNCDPQVDAHITFWDQNDLNNRSNVLSLDEKRSTARGVGIRLYKENQQPVELGKEWLFSQQQIQPQQTFSAKYVNVDGKVSAGTVSAVATVTFSYR